MDLSLFDLTGKKALVTGGSTGIGRACATALAMGGADVAIVARNESTGLKAVESIKKMGVDSFFVQCDVSQEQQIQAMTANVVERFGRLDIAINNAGISMQGSDLTMKKADWDSVIAVNLTGVWLCAQAQVRQMSQQTPMGGKIINIASVAARSVNGRSGSAYVASKAAVVHLTHSLAAQFGCYNINVNCVSPGFVMTPLTTSISSEYRERLREIIPMGYVARPEDIHGSILFLASSASNYMTGHDLLLDGGRTLSTWIQPTEKRKCPAHIAPEEEIVALKKDLDTMNT